MLIFSETSRSTVLFEVRLILKWILLIISITKYTYIMSFNRILLTVATLITLISTLLIGLSTTRLSQTHDEPTHIASGIEYLQGEYILNPQNPPISRLGLAILPFLSGVRVVKPDDFYEKFWGYGGGAGLVQKSMEEVGDYQEILVLARLGVMIYFLVALVLVFLIGKILSNSSGGAICVILFATTPVVMAHSGLATTDVPSMTTYLLAFLILIWWFEKPTWVRSIWLGLALSLAVTTKFTAIVFITPLILILYLLKVYLGKKTDLSFFNHLKFFSLAIISSSIFTWAIYGFSWGEVGAIPIDPLATFNGSENVTLKIQWQQPLIHGMPQLQNFYEVMLIIGV